VLVGNVFQDEQGPYLHIEASIRGQHAGNLAAQVTFTGETWSHIHDQMEKHHAGRSILGWYHTHPGFGIFLSAMDLFIQDNFFNLPWQVAHVYDPVADDEGMFVWQAGKPVRAPFLVEEDADEEQPAVTLVPAEGTPSDPVPALGTLAARLDRLEKQHKGLLVLVLLVALVAGIALGVAIGLAAGGNWQTLLSHPADTSGEKE
jgi:proteasome lid subunit RPN8/RPN11